MIETDYRDDITRAVETLRRGGVIVYPTDTIWGIGCDARNSEAVRRIYAIKRRDDSKALITLVDSLAGLERIVDEVPEVAEQLIDVSVDPVTIIYDRGRNVAPELLAADGSIGVRVTREAFSAALCRAFRGPIVSTSANVSAQPSPMDFCSIAPEILDAADYVCTSRRDEPAATKASSVIKISSGGLFKILRK
ncbi:MAG: L-threonylcarbamoyladenylate synthase [Bacteroidales bacterium]|nr:L-threonylcarbamoyladenylate synthase [Bacteroidales bacterium]